MKVIHVNSERGLKKFNKLVNKSKGKMMVVFVANWCGHCQHLKPIWAQMEKTVKKTKCISKGIVAMIYSDYRERVNVNSDCAGFPTIRLFKNGKNLGDWQGDWTKNKELEKKALSYFKQSNKTKKNKTFKKKSKKIYKNKTLKRRKRGKKRS